MYIISKIFKFEAAHRLYPYKGKCARIHGHSYQVTVQVRRSDNGIAEGMVTDFANLNGFKKRLDELYDHKLILSFDDPFRKFLDELDSDLFEEIVVNGRVSFDGSPTAENMAKSIANLLRKCLDEDDLADIEIVQVVIGETCTSEASYIPGGLK